MEVGVPWRLILCFISMLCLFIVSLVLVSYIPFSFIVICSFMASRCYHESLKIIKAQVRIDVSNEEKPMLQWPPKPENWKVGSLGPAPGPCL